MTFMIQSVRIADGRAEMFNPSTEKSFYSRTAAEQAADRLRDIERVRRRYGSTVDAWHYHVVPACR